MGCCDPVVIVVRRGIDRVGILIERFSLECTEENAIPTDDDAGFVPIRTQSESTWREIERQSVDRIEYGVGHSQHTMSTILMRSAIDN